MVTAILPSVTVSEHQDSSPSPPEPSCARPTSSSIESDLTVTPLRWAEEQRPHDPKPGLPWHSVSGTRLAGFVGAFAGFGALLALGCFLPLPSSFEKHLYGPEDALKMTYYLVGSISLLIALLCFFGLRDLKGEEEKGIHALCTLTSFPGATHASRRGSRLPYWKLFYYSLRAGRHPHIGLGYVGGFVARASSVGISLFLPLLVNHYYISTGRCRVDETTDVKSQCREAYVLAAKLTGVSQLLALILAPAYALFSEKHGRFHIPLLVASLCGILGYGAFAFLVQSPDPTHEDGSNLIYVWVSLLGAGQIGAVVCSLGLISRGVQTTRDAPELLKQSNGTVSTRIDDSAPTSQDLGRDSV